MSAQERKTTVSGNHHAGINAGGNISIGGDVDASVTSHTTYQTTWQQTDVRPVTDDLRQRVAEVVDALAAAGLDRRPELARTAVELRSEVEGSTARPARVEQLLGAIETHAVQIATIAAAVTAARIALSR